MKINLKFNMKSYLKFSSILVVGATSSESKYGGKGLPPSLGWVFPVALSRRVVRCLQALGASCTDGAKSKKEPQGSYRPKNLTI